LKTLKKPGLVVFYTGLLAALSLGVIGSCSLRHMPVLQAEIQRMDEKAQPHFEEARRNIPSVVEQMTEIGSTCKLCWLMARDKLTGTQETQGYLTSILNEPIITPCRKGASVYGCDFNSTGFLNELKSVNADYAESEAYAVSGLAIETIFLKQTVASLSTVLGTVVAKLARACGSGVVSSAADGPFPVGDAIGVLLATGGTAWCGYDLYKAREQLSVELTVMLKQLVNDCHAACRKAALK